MKKWLAAMMAAVLSMSLLTACGSTAQEAAPEETAQTEQAEETAQEETPAEDTAQEETSTEDTAAVSEALADGVLNVGTNAEFPPFEYVNDAGNRMVSILR